LGSVRIGVLGGTFNPVHLGHLHIARRIQSIFSLDQVQFVVASMPPHKRPEDLIPFMHRYAMVSLATSGEPSFIPSLIELAPHYSCFSIDTMRKLAKSVGNKGEGLFFIAGGDSLMEVHSWRESEKLLTAYNFIFVVRPGTGSFIPAEHLPAKLVSRVRDFTGLKQSQVRRLVAEESKDGNRIYIVDAKAPDISSTQIRCLAASRKSLRRLVPDPVCTYIRKLHLYGGR
jgi:nicotinate-nucleotide adenylyltransferase